MLAQAGSSALRPNEMLILRPTFYVLAADETKYTFISADQEIILQSVLDDEIAEPPYIASSSTSRCTFTLAVDIAITEIVRSTNVPTSLPHFDKGEISSQEHFRLILRTVLYPNCALGHLLIPRCLDWRHTSSKVECY